MGQNEDVLKNYILENYKSVRAFTLAIGLPYTTVANIFKRGLDSSGVALVVGICDFLNIKTDDLLQGKIVYKPESGNPDTEILTDKTEKSIIRTYRHLTPENQRSLRRFLKFTWSEQQKDSQQKPPLDSLEDKTVKVLRVARTKKNMPAKPPQMIEMSAEDFKKLEDAEETKEL